MKDITAFIKGSLESTNHCSIPPGQFKISEQIEVRHEQCLEGASLGSTRLIWKGDKDQHYGIVIGKNRRAVYRSTVQKFTLDGTGVDIQRASQQVVFRDVYAGRSPEHAFKAIGAQMSGLVFDNCHAVASEENGFTIVSNRANNSVTLQNCGASGCGINGVYAGTSDSWHAHLPFFLVAGGVFQGNAQYDGGSEIHLKGNLTNATIVNAHLETVGPGSGLVVSPQSFKSRSEARFPIDLSIHGCDFHGKDANHSIAFNNSPDGYENYGGTGFSLTGSRLHNPIHYGNEANPFRISMNGMLISPAVDESGQVKS